MTRRWKRLYNLFHLHVSAMEAICVEVCHLVSYVQYTAVCRRVILQGKIKWSQSDHDIQKGVALNIPKVMYVLCSGAYSQVH